MMAARVKSKGSVQTSDFFVCMFCVVQAGFPLVF